jgi:AraC-like DNA-binding protein
LLTDVMNSTMPALVGGAWVEQACDRVGRGAAHPQVSPKDIAKRLRCSRRGCSRAFKVRVAP